MIILIIKNFIHHLSVIIYKNRLYSRRLYMHNKRSTENQGPLIALVGCDGSGKSTLSFDLAKALNQTQPTQCCYLGQGSGNIGRKISQLKLGGPLLGRIIDKKAGAARTKGKKIPGVLTALVIFIFSCIRFLNFKKMMRLRKEGVLIITDRYPQTDVVGFYDGPGLSAALTKNRFIRFLVRSEYKLYDYMASIKPDLVIRLNIDAETAYRRKPDHDYSLLKIKVDATQKLKFREAPIVDLDARLPYKDVYEMALKEIEKVLSRS